MLFIVVTRVKAQRDIFFRYTWDEGKYLNSRTIFLELFLKIEKENL